MEDQNEEEKETYDEVKEAIDVPDPQDDQGIEAQEEEKPKAKAKPKAKPKVKPEPKPEPARPGKNDKVECQDCGKTMNANTLRYRHTCKPPKSQEIQKEKPREPQIKRNRDVDSPPESPRTKMVKYYREARVAQQSQKRAMYASWLGN